VNVFTGTFRISLNREGSKMAEKIKVTLVKSSIGSIEKIKATLTGLGLTKLNKTVTRKDTPEIRGMIAKVSHLVRTEEV
jgi:large subunit ribosomal protein L30